MVHRMLCCASAVVLLAAGAVLAQDEGHEGMHEGMEMEGAQTDPMMQAMMEAAKVGPQHEMLAGWAGTWDAEVSMWMAPGTEPMTTGGTVRSEILAGGRVLRETHTATMMGMPFEGVGHTGYDNTKGTFWNIWFDNMGTAFYPSEGSWDAETGKLTLEGDWPSPDGTMMHVKMVGWSDAPDHRIFQMWTTMGDQTFQSMEASYTRATE